MPLVLRAMLITLLAFWSLPAGALESAQVVSSRATASLVSDVDSVAPGRAFRVGLRLQLATGWHTYWQNPGDAGVPPELNFDVAHRCDGRTDCLADAAAGARRVADDLCLHWRACCCR